MFAHRLRLWDFAEKLQGDVIVAAAHKTHAGKARQQGAHVIVQPLLDGFVDIEGNKEAHGVSEFFSYFLA